MPKPICRVMVLPLWQAKNAPGVVISTVCKDTPDLSPFTLGPCDLYEGYTSFNMENAWQYSKVYKPFVDKHNEPTQYYFDWAIAGWNDRRANRYPMGKGIKPLYSLWKGERLDYVTARKVIYGPLYVEQVTKSFTYKKLLQMYKTERVITLLDYDAYDHRALGMTLTDVINNPTKKMGHAFILAMLLTNDKALNELYLRQ